MAIFKVLDVAVLAVGAVFIGFLSFRYSLATIALRGLRMYVPAAADAQGSSKKKGKTKAIGDGKDDIPLGGAETLLIYPASLSQIQQAQFYQVLETLVYALQLAVFTAIAYPLLHTYAGSSFHSTPLAMAAAVAGLCLSSLASVDLFSKLVSPVDRGYAVIFACGGFMVSAFLFGLDPVGLFVWDPHNAMEAAKGLIETLLRRTMLDASPEEIAAAAFTPSPLALQLLYSIFAAVLTALLFAPALRFVRAYTLQQRPPVWAEEEFIKPHAVATARLHLHLVLPLLCAVTWVRPLFCDPLGLPERTAFVARAAAAIVTGIIMISNCRILAARYLDTALVAWWTLKHGAKRSSTNRANTGVIIQAKCEVVRRLMCKAAVQGIAPGAFILCCGLALAAFLPEDFTEAGTTAGNLSSLVTSVAGFLIWWTGCVWFLLCSGILWLFRTGTLQN